MFDAFLTSDGCQSRPFGDRKELCPFLLALASMLLLLLTMISCLMSLTKVDAVRKLFTAEKIFPSNLKRFWGVLVCYVESVVMVVVVVMVVLVTVMLGALVPSTLS